MRALHAGAGAVAIGLIIGFGLGIAIAPGTIQTVTTTVPQNSLLVSDPTPYFPSGHVSNTVNMSRISNGDVVDVGQAEFLLVIPSNIETRTTQFGGTTTVITVTAEYQCGISLGQRMFFDAKLPGNMTVRLDYCLILNSAVQAMQKSGNFSTNWSLWEITVATHPTVALHTSGTGEHVESVELWSSS
jgi:hypothetical protein